MLIPVPTRHRVESQGYRFSLRRPGKFNPAAAAEHGIPQKSWSLLQRGKPVTLEDGTVVLPQQILGPDRKGLSISFSGDTAWEPDEAADSLSEPVDAGPEFVHADKDKETARVRSMAVTFFIMCLLSFLCGFDVI